jgi:hypothetical protein
MWEGGRKEGRKKRKKERRKRERISFAGFEVFTLILTI